jgi:signal transduction histidine kinase
LAISKELITLLGGTIGVRSAPGQGRRFGCTLLPPKIEAGSQDNRAKMVMS